MSRYWTDYSAEPHGYMVLTPYDDYECSNNVETLWGYGDTPQLAIEDAAQWAEDDEYQRCPHCDVIIRQPNWQVVRCGADVMNFRPEGTAFEWLIWDWSLRGYVYAENAWCIACHSDDEAGEMECELCDYGRAQHLRNDVSLVVNLDPGFLGRALIRYVARMAGEEPLV